MGIIKKPPPSVRFAAVFSCEDRFLKLAWDRLETHWGEIARLGPALDFTESLYYTKTMWMPPETTQPVVLRKQMALFKEPYDPSELASDKLQSNRLEHVWTSELVGSEHLGGESEKRLINIDPGYLTMTKLVLASTKNREHRVYLRDGIYAEVTLAFRDQAWAPMPWTYADYQRPDVHEFLSMARKGFVESVAQSNRLAGDQQKNRN
jgi:hypothetical protein